MNMLIIGGYGFFGGKLSELLANESGLNIILAGRNFQKAQAACDKYIKGVAKFSALRFDRNKDRRFRPVSKLWGAALPRD